MFRPCIDLHEGKVKQIAGLTLNNASRDLQTNFVSDRPASWYAALYSRDALRGGHVIMLGPGNEEQALGALKAYPGGLQIGGGINVDNARAWLEAGASHVIVTSYVFREGHIDWTRLAALAGSVGKDRLVLDLSCRKIAGEYLIATNYWQKITNVGLSRHTFEELGAWCSEFLVHAVDVEGFRGGIDEDLVGKLARWSTLPTTYAGGARSLQDLERVTALGQGRIDLTIGSALDIFGGTEVKYADAVQFNKKLAARPGRLAPTQKNI